MQTKPTSKKADGIQSSLFSGPPLGAAVKLIGLGLAWFVIWAVPLWGSAELAVHFYLNDNQQEGFAAALGMMGVLMIAPLGFLLSILIAWKMGRRWPFFVGAAVTGTGTVPLLLFAFA